MSDEPGSSSLEIAVSIHDAAWLEAFGDLEARAGAAVRTALECAGGDSVGGAAPLEVSLVFTDDAEQRSLNGTWRGKDRPTNVLSFPNMDETPNMDRTGATGAPRLLGDVVLARETVLREAAEQGKSPANHTLHLVVHGLLHLLGHDHEAPEEAAAMEALERSILARLDIPDPYAGPDAAETAEVNHG